MPLLVAASAFTYATKLLAPGDEFEAIDKDARILKLAKLARDAKPRELERAKPSDMAPARQLETRRASDQSEVSGPQPRQGRYSRRDMRAHD